MSRAFEGSSSTTRISGLTMSTLLRCPSRCGPAGACATAAMGIVNEEGRAFTLLVCSSITPPCSSISQRRMTSPRPMPSAAPVAATTTKPSLSFDQLLEQKSAQRLQPVAQPRGSLGAAERVAHHLRRMADGEIDAHQGRRKRGTARHRLHSPAPLLDAVRELVDLIVLGRAQTARLVHGSGEPA